tara:strand:+ start:18910 stop:20082 length:1173 start_codon:yes stop_codon:yes gene_type:complete
MKVIISIEPIRYPLTGIGRYTYELVRQFQSESTISELKYFSGRKFVHTLPDMVNDYVDEGANSLKRKLLGNFKNLLLRNKSIVDMYQGILPYIQRSALKESESYIYHGPNFYLPPAPGKKVVTFHDLSIYTHPEFHPSERVRYMRKALKYTFDHADALITDSEYTRNEVISYFGYPANKVFSVPLASAAEFRPRSHNEISPILSEYAITLGEYSLYVGTIEPRKNLDVLIQAYSRLPMELRRRWPLILAGYRGWKSESIHQKIKKAEHEGWARYIGFTPAEHLPVLFSGARLFVFPSRYEGFGLPVLEALSSGVPVVCSNSSSLPEVTGNCALTSDPDDVDMLTSNIRRGLEDDIWRKRSIEDGFIQSQKFSWTRCAQETLNVYRSIGSK